MVQQLFFGNATHDHFMLRYSLIAIMLLLGGCAHGGVDGGGGGPSSTIAVPPSGIPTADAPPQYAGLQPYGENCADFAVLLGKHLGHAVESLTKNGRPDGIYGWYRKADGSFVAANIPDDEFAGGVVFTLTAYAFTTVFADYRRGPLVNGCGSSDGFFGEVINAVPEEMRNVINSDPGVRGKPEQLLGTLAQQMRLFMEGTTVAS